jgi:hypothetical protein
VLETELHERFIEQGMPLQRGREIFTRGESPGKPEP